MTENALPKENAEKTDATQPTEPIDKMEPAEPIDKIDPVEAIDKIEPLDPMLSSEPAEPGDCDTAFVAIPRLSHCGRPHGRLTCWVSAAAASKCSLHAWDVVDAQRVCARACQRHRLRGLR